jgi:hypothetical protein
LRSFPSLRPWQLRANAGKNLGSYKDAIIAIFVENALTHNAAKTTEFKLPDTASQQFEYLGYRFTCINDKFEVSPSAAKVEKYRARMNASFEDYWRERPVNPKGAFRKLVGRIKFLTGNTRLSNSKSRAVTGIYYNNSIVTDLSDFKQLDKELEVLVTATKWTTLQKQLKKLKFTAGFVQRRYHSFSTRELQTIVRAWKHG